MGFKYISGVLFFCEYTSFQPINRHKNDGNKSEIVFNFIELVIYKNLIGNLIYSMKKGSLNKRCYLDNSIFHKDY